MVYERLLLGPYPKNILVKDMHFRINFVEKSGGYLCKARSDFEYFTSRQNPDSMVVLAKCTGARTIQSLPQFSWRGFKNRRGLLT